MKVARAMRETRRQQMGERPLGAAAGGEESGCDHGGQCYEKRRNHPAAKGVVTDAVGQIEAPEPRCATGSAVAVQIADVRRRIAARFPAVPARPGIPVTLTGVGFFDIIRGFPGQAPNGIELHPILAIEWR